MQIFWQGKAQNSSPILRCTFLARRSAKLIDNFSATMVTSLPSFSLCISLSLFHRIYLTHNIGNASAFPTMKKTSEQDTGFFAEEDSDLEVCKTLRISQIFSQNSATGPFDHRVQTACAKCSELGVRGWCTFSRLRLTGEICLRIIGSAEALPILCVRYARCVCVCVCVCV